MDKEALNELLEYMEELIHDRGLPKSVRETISKIVADMKKGDEPLDVKLSSAIYALNDVSENINLQMQARSEIWNLISKLESVKGS